MANRYVRIYEKPRKGLEKPATLLGLSLSSCVSIEPLQEALGANYTVRELSPDSKRDRRIISRLGDIAPWGCYEIQPPLPTEQEDVVIQSLISMCKREVKPHGNAGYLIDHRGDQPPFKPYDPGGTVLAVWYN